jgi:hypothetical protein
MLWMGLIPSNLDEILIKRIWKVNLFLLYIVESICVPLYMQAKWKFSLYFQLETSSRLTQGHYKLSTSQAQPLTQIGVSSLEL